MILIFFLFLFRLIDSHTSSLEINYPNFMTEYLPENDFFLHTRNIFFHDF